MVTIDAGGMSEIELIPSVSAHNFDSLLEAFWRAPEIVPMNPQLVISDTLKISCKVNKNYKI